MATDAEKLRKLARKELDDDLKENVPANAPDSELLLALETQALRLQRQIIAAQVPMAERLKHIR